MSETKKDNTKNDPDTEEELNSETATAVKNELELLTIASSSINHAELELEEARQEYQDRLATARKELYSLRSQLGSCVRKAQPYYILLRQAKEKHCLTEQAVLDVDQAKQELERCHKLADSFRTQASCSDISTAAMQSLLTSLMETVEKSSELEQKVSRCWMQHQKAVQDMVHVQEQLSSLCHDLSATIVKSRVYYNRRTELANYLLVVKRRAELISKAVMDTKKTYDDILHNLSELSMGIHRSRGSNLDIMDPTTGKSQSLCSSPCPSSDSLTDVEDGTSAAAMISSSVLKTDLEKIGEASIGRRITLEDLQEFCSMEDLLEDMPTEKSSLLSPSLAVGFLRKSFNTRSRRNPLASPNSKEGPSEGGKDVRGRSLSLRIGSLTPKQNITEHSLPSSSLFIHEYDVIDAPKPP